MEGETNGKELVLAGGDANPNLAALVVRLDSLANAMAMLRTHIGERLTDYGRDVSRTQALYSRESADYRTAVERGLGDIERALRDNEAALDRLRNAIGSATARTERATEALTVRIDALAGEVRGDAHRAAELQNSSAEGLRQAWQNSEDAVRHRLDDQLAALSEQQRTDVADLRQVLEQHLAAVDAQQRRDAAALQDRLSEGLASAAGQIEALRRRIPLRARSDNERDQALADRVADALVERLRVGGEVGAAPWES